MRYNFHYLSTIEVASGQPSYQNGNQSGFDIIELIVQGLLDNALLLLIVLYLNLLVIPFPLLAHWVAKLDLVIIGFMFVEFAAFGKLGGFTETFLYQNCSLLRFGYDWILDWDGSAARLILSPHEYDFGKMRWKEG